jgi:hypothetical protein
MNAARWFQHREDYQPTQIPLDSCLTIYDCNLTRNQPRQERENFGYQRQGFIKLGAACDDYHHRDLKFGGVLLKAQIAVGGQENIEFRLRQREQLAIFDAAPAHFLNGNAIMPGQRAAQTPVEALGLHKKQIADNLLMCVG